VKQQKVFAFFIRFLRISYEWETYSADLQHVQRASHPHTTVQLRLLQNNYIEKLLHLTVAPIFRCGSHTHIPAYLYFCDFINIEFEKMNVMFSDISEHQTPAHENPSMGLFGEYERTTY
jgi:hypothetical protein